MMLSGFFFGLAAGLILGQSVYLWLDWPDTEELRRWRASQSTSGAAE